MSIFLKSHLEEPLKSLDRYYQELRQTLEGVAPSGNLAHLYGFEDRDHFAADHTDVDLRRLARALAHFKVEVEDLKNLKSLAIKPAR